VDELTPAWGPVREVWEGYAADPEIRLAGSSGGAATALSLFALERGGMHGVLHTAARPDRPYLNHTVLSTTRAELLAATGSRYAPASPCDGLQRVEAAPGPCLFVGKPCDVAATQRARRLRPALDAKLGLVVAFFCAGTPSTKGTLELLRKVGVEDPARVSSLRYRGNGWPGRWTVVFRVDGGEEQTRTLSYEESWDFLQRYRQWRCYICPDHTGEFADIAVGDPWYRPIEPGEPGTSLLVARTERGVRFLREAADAGYVVLERSDPSLLPRSQPNLLTTRGRIWASLFALRLARAPTPAYRGFPTFPFWRRRFTAMRKLRSILGTFKRVRLKGLRRRVTVREWTPPDPPADDSSAAGS
jgi:coenzyme F420 hydrogenase subunit beta